ncbi:hypothetical protein MMC30_007561 [Trapelia coarctata]|nr:hypothetical protein [Trapelia coarctata]
MTIDLTASFRERNNLIQPLQRTFYPHPQLKNFISIVDKDIIYYASKSQVYALHTLTRRRERIATLSLTPQCLGAGFGWICVGGKEKGRCAFVKLGNAPLSSAASQPAATHSAEVDALLPLDLDPESRLLALSYLGDHGERSYHPRPAAKVEYHELGGLIVNSITVHKIRCDNEGEQDEIVAVIANNDETARIFSLDQSRVLQTLQFPTAVNHSTISPDGKLLVACGDTPQAFFYRRRPMAGLAAKDTVDSYPRYEWQQIAAPKLSRALTKDACFATAFSPSGHMCAVGAQGGTITVFDTSLIQDDMEADDAVIDVFATSRPGRDLDDMVGAVRSMAFGPEPWELFAWAEDQGRVCVADIRDRFTSRQTIELDINGSSIERVDVLDFEVNYITAEQRELEIEARFVQRHREALDAQDHLAAVNHAADYMELAAERRRLQHELREIGQSEASDLNPHALTESERQILDSLRMERQRAVNRGAERQDPDGRAFSINYSPTGDIDPRPAALGSSSGNTSIRQYMRERNIERNLDRGMPRAYQPRRQGSVVISNSNSSSNTPLSSQPASLATIGATASALSTSPSRIPSTTADTNSTRPTSSSTSPPLLPIPTSTTDPWHTISAAMAASSATTAAFDTIARLRLERERDLENLRRMREREREATEASVSNFERRIQQSVRAERFRTNRLRQLRDGGDDTTYEDYELDVLRQLAGVSRRNEGNRITTMGIGWSKDGGLLYVGTEEGILEYRVNIQERKMFPAVAFR